MSQPVPSTPPLADLAALAERIDACLLADRPALQRQLAQLRERPRDIDRLQRLLDRLERSESRAASRRAALPSPEFPPQLPIVERLGEVRALLERHQVVVLCGETGSGKSTQLPKLCLAMGRGVFGRIGHTQPRRIAARSLAARVASELGQEVGASVGYKVRFHDRIGADTHVKLMTDGILLAEIQHDRELREYDTLIIDEAHERSLNIDLLLGYLRQLLPRRPDLKVIVTSATIDPQRFSRHFSGAPVIEVSGRTYPVEVRYRPLGGEGADGADDAATDADDDPQQAIIDAVDELGRIDRGDILVFLPGEREIRETAEALSKHRLTATEVLPLYARLGPAEQARIFKPTGQRRIVLATNVAETSLTVPGIRYVIDTGYARISRYSHRSKIQRLPVEPISQASADQRKGRCGRVAAGVCIRLYGEEDFNGRPAFTDPEILRTNLAAVILQMKVLGFGEMDRFPFVEPPDGGQIKDGYRLLEELGAVDTRRRVTRLGRKLARLPIDPRIGRMLLEAAHTGCLREVLVIAAALSVQDPRERPLDKQQQADEAHAEFKDERSDFLGYLNLWRFLEDQRKHLTRRKFQRLCRERFLSANRVQEWRDIHLQLRTQLHEMGYRDNEAEADADNIHRALLAGLLSQIACRPETGGHEYQGTRNTRCRIFPGSALFAKPPKWFMAAELVETTRLYARTVAAINPDWVESLAGHLVKRQYSEPHWQRKRGQVGAYEKVTLYGLTLVARRRINYGPIDPVVSRELFIRFGLVEGDFETRAPFWRHNRELIADVHDMEAKSRRRDILVDEERIYAFYDARIPEGIYAKPAFEQWLRQASQQDRHFLHLRMADLLRPEAPPISAEYYPDALEAGGLRLPLDYSFEPGQSDDGVTIRVPVGLLDQLDTTELDWLVPGLREDKVIALLKSLPKGLRKHFVPAPDVAKRCLAVMTPGELPLLQALGATLRQLTGVQVPEDAWKPETLPDHLQMRIAVVDAAGELLATGRDAARLKREFAGYVDDAPAAAATTHTLERDSVTDWDFGDLPDEVETRTAGIALRGRPALVAEADGRVALRVLGSEAALAAHRLGLRRLIQLRLSREMRYLRRNLPDLKAMRLSYAKAAAAPDGGAGGRAPADIEDELVEAIIDTAFLADSAEIRTRAAFEAALEAGRTRLMMVANDLCTRLAEVLKRYQQVRQALSRITQIHWLAAAEDMRAQLDGLVYRGFLAEIGPQRLAEYPRYLAALQLRLDKLRHAAPRDQQWLRELQQVLQPWRERTQARQAQGRRDPRLEEIRWMLEELRISLFAQEVGTAYPVSVKRVEKRWRELGL